MKTSQLKNRKAAALFGLLLCMGGLFLAASVSGQAGFQHRVDGSVMPWTSAPEIAGQDYRFVVIGDLTGGEHPGVFDFAVQRINELAPDFVVTVGDLVEGYTYDPGVADQQWQRFRNSLSRLEMPFFMVPGNHDLTNSMMLEKWNALWGYPFYSFRINDAHYVVLNSNEPGEEGFSSAQVSYVKEALKLHPAGAPLYVFLHEPFWQLEGKPGHAALDSLFAGYDSRFFCGHEHRYQHRIINDKPHYMLSSLAGVPGRKGHNLGEYNNLMLVTVRGNKVSLSNIDLNGLLPVDLVNDRTIRQVDILRRGRWARLAPTVPDAGEADVFRTVLTLTNPGDHTLTVSGEMAAPEGHTVFPGSVEEELTPGDKKEIAIALKSGTPVNPDNLPGLNFRIRGTYVQEDKVLASEDNLKWTIDYIRESVWRGEKPVPEFDLVPFGVEEDWDWSGREDAGMMLAVTHDRENIYLEVSLTDDHFVSDPGMGEKTDGCRVYFSPDTSLSAKAFALFEFSPGDEGVKMTDPSGLAGKSSGEVSMESNRLTARIVIPRKNLRGDRFRVNLAYEDVDVTHQTDHAVLWWRPRWGSGSDYRNSGVFRVDE
jgi:hypothetical protein